MTENKRPWTHRQIAKHLAKTMQCNCDLDNWQPESNTGHSWVCRIHKAAMSANPAAFDGEGK